MSLFVFFISLLIVAQHVSGNYVPIIRSWRLSDVIALCWYVPWLQGGGQDQQDVNFCILYFSSNICSTCFGNYVPIIRSWRLRDVIALCWYVPWLQEGGQDQQDVNFCILHFSSNSCSTCFGQPCAHHQELTTEWCYSLVLVCAVAAGRLSRPTRCKFLYSLFLL